MMPLGALLQASPEELLRALPADLQAQARQDVEDVRNGKMPEGLQKILGEAGAKALMSGEGSDGSVVVSMEALLGAAPGPSMQASPDEQRLDALEATCSRMVDKLQPDAAPAPASTKAAAAEDKTWGKGLSKGFLNGGSKKRSKRKTAAPDETTPATTRTAPTTLPLGQLDVNVCAPAEAAMKPSKGQEARPTKMAASHTSRCGVCHKRLPVTAVLGAKCKCGDLFCGAHMQSHACSFDYRAQARDQLRRANPEIAPTKL